MKKIFAVCLLTLFVGSAFAQTAFIPYSSSYTSSGGLGFPGNSSSASLSAADIKADIMAADLNRDAHAADTAGITSSKQKLAARRKDLPQAIPGRR